MKDNYPNYLNPHNIDPGRIESARIDNPPGNDSIRPGREQAPWQTEMTIETAIDILKFVEGDIYERIAIRKVIEVLSSADDINVARSPWVKTSDRLPTEEDAGFLGQVMTCYHDEWDCFQFLEKWDEVPVRENLYWHGLPMPPEVEK